MESIKINFDALGFLALFLTLVSILFSFNLSPSEIIMSVGIFLIIVVTLL